MGRLQAQLPISWEYKLIPEILFFQEGPGVRKTQFTEQGIKLLNVGNLNLQKLDLSTTAIFISKEEAYGKYKHFLVDSGDLLIACSGIVVDNFHNKMAFATSADLPLCLNTSTMRFKVLDHKSIKIEYFRYFLQTELFKKQLRKLITGSAQLNFGPSHIKKIQIPLPPLPTQKKIAAILDKADELRQNDKKILEKYDELAQSVFLEMFGDPVRNEKEFPICTIRDLVTEAKYGTSGKAAPIGKYPYLRMNNITYSGFWDLKDLKYIDLSESDKDKYVVKKGDILFNRTNSKELVGKTGVFELETPMAIAGYLIRVRVNELAKPYFIWGYLNSKHGKMTLKNMCKSIVGMANINAQELQEIKILKPPLILQEKYESIITEIIKQKETTNQSLQKSEELFQSLLQRAFRGELG